ncbi:MAG: WecB/TagA/CpsF family glycosyltransferase [Candidatus Nitrotoga sp.]
MTVANEKIIGVRVDRTSYQAAVDLVLNWAQKHESRYVCAANVHMVMEAYDSPKFHEVLSRADLVTPDGMPLVWMLRQLGATDQTRVYGPDLLLWVVRVAAQKKIPVGFYGGTQEVLNTMVNGLKIRHPDIDVSYEYSPPFRPLSPEEKQKVIKEINASGVNILFVGLGCPRQEYWMAENREYIKSVMIGVGAAIDFHAGRKAQAPSWMQGFGLEWLFRLLVEPRRLWMRYLYHNPRFLVLAFLQLTGLYKVGA